VVAGQTDVFPSERRDMDQKVVGDIRFLIYYITGDFGVPRLLTTRR
jgi:hypothetical protein